MLKVIIQQTVRHFSKLSEEPMHFSPTLRLNAVKKKRSIVFLLHHSMSTLILNFSEISSLYLIIAYHAGTTLITMKHKLR